MLAAAGVTAVLEKGAYSLVCRCPKVSTCARQSGLKHVDTVTIPQSWGRALALWGGQPPVEPFRSSVKVGLPSQQHVYLVSRVCKVVRVGTGVGVPGHGGAGPNQVNVMCTCRSYTTCCKLRNLEHLGLPLQVQQQVHSRSFPGWGQA